MKYGTFCSGIEACTVAWHPLGWEPIFFSEIAPFPSKVLAYHYPGVPNLGSMATLFENEVFLNAAIDLICAGTPCQSFSLAGLRGGMADARGNLSLTFAQLLLRKQSKWFIWENVPGVFSSFSDAEESDEPEIWETSDFANLLEAFRQCGYSCAYRVLDAQYFGVPQRRRRVFVVGYLGNDWRPPAAVLFEPESLRGDITPGRKQRQRIAGKINSGVKDGSIPGKTAFSESNIVPWVMDTGQANTSININQTGTLTASHEHPILFVSATGFDAAQITNKTNRSILRPGIQPTLLAGGNPMVITVSPFQSSGNDYGVGKECIPYSANTSDNGAILNQSVRRLTPLECERLQGFPDHYTAIPGTKDSSRYKAIGNSMAVPVMRWIGERIQSVNNIIKEKK